MNWMGNSLKSIVLLIVVWAGTIGVVTAQDRPVFLPEDINVSTIQLKCFCQPGVRNKSRSRGLDIAYGLTTNSRFELDSENDRVLSENNLVRYYHFKLKAPVIFKDDFKLIIGAGFKSEHLFFRNSTAFESTFDALSDDRLKNNDFNLLVIKSLNEKQYLSGRYKYAAKGNFDGVFSFENDFGVHNALAVFGVKPSEDLEWGIGLSYTQSFRRNSFIPFFVYNKNFSPKWGIESVLPAMINIRHNINSSNIVLAGVEFNSVSYRLKFNDPAFGALDYAFNHSELQFAIEYEMNLTPWVWVSFKGGYLYNFNTDFEGKNARTEDFVIDPSNNMFTLFSIFLSPPDSFKTKHSPQN